MMRYQKGLAAFEEIKKTKSPKEADRKTKIKYRLRLKQAEDLASRWEDRKGVEQLPKPIPELWQRACKI